MKFNLTLEHVKNGNAWTSIQLAVYTVVNQKKPMEETAEEYKGGKMKGTVLTIKYIEACAWITVCLYSEYAQHIKGYSKEDLMQTMADNLPLLHEIALEVIGNPVETIGTVFSEILGKIEEENVKEILDIEKQMEEWEKK